MKPPYEIPPLAEIRGRRHESGLVAASTFSGCGGSSLGLNWAGIDVRWASEFVPEAADVYELNFPNTPVDRRDIREVEAADILEAVGVDKGDLDVFEGSPPCASFSMSGNRQSDWGNEKKYSTTKQRADDLFFEFVRLVDGLQPRSFIAENVEGLTLGVAKGYLREIVRRLAACGYRVGVWRLDAQWLGVPQRRVRLVINGLRKDQPGQLIAPRPLPYNYTWADLVAKPIPDRGEPPAPYDLNTKVARVLEKAKAGSVRAGRPGSGPVFQPPSASGRSACAVHSAIEQSGHGAGGRAKNDARGDEARMRVPGRLRADRAVRPKARAVGQGGSSADVQRRRRSGPRSVDRERSETMKEQEAVPDIGGRDVSGRDPLRSYDEHRDVTMPDGAWEFDEAVTDVFDDMLARSIPQYDVMRSTVTSLACAWLPTYGRLLDIGCSRGGALAAVRAERPDVRCVGLEVSEPMIAAAQDRFAEDDRVVIDRVDLREWNRSAMYAADVALAVLTIQFTPIEYRMQILDQVRQVTTGPLILVEKVLGSSARIDDEMVAAYYAVKAANGYTQEQIDAKRHALEGQLVPVTASMNEDFLRAAGYRQVDCFWRWMNFAGWIALP